MLGRYEYFPQNLHGIANVQYQNSPKELQCEILRAFYRLNSEVFDLCSITPYLKQKCEVSFEFGVADGSDFIFLDQNELDLCLKSVNETECGTLDFFFAVRYHLIRESGKRVALRFDYHVLRLFFQQGIFELQIRHEKGTQRVPLDDLTKFLVKKINIELSLKNLQLLNFRNFEKIVIQ